jgi:prepilin-type N-terminal cleavage/methylation domain-containing protein
MTIDDVRLTIDGARPNRQSTIDNRHLRGLTLVEILVSVAILASAAVLIMQALAKGAYVSTLAHNRLRAYAFSTAKLTDLEVAFAQGLTPDSEGEFRDGRQSFHWLVETAPAAADPALEQVTLTVDWRQGRHAHDSHVTMVRRLPAVPVE